MSACPNLSESDKFGQIRTCGHSLNLTEFVRMSAYQSSPKKRWSFLFISSLYDGISIYVKIGEHFRALDSRTFGHDPRTCGHGFSDKRTNSDKFGLSDMSACPNRSTNRRYRQNLANRVSCRRVVRRTADWRADFETRGFEGRDLPPIFFPVLVGI